MQTEQDGLNGFTLDQHIKANELLRRRKLGENILLLKIMKDKQLYKAVLGDENAEWAGYLGEVEVFYSRNEIYTLMRIYDKFVTDLGLEYANISDIPKSRLVEMLSVVNADNMEDLLSKARLLTSRDFTDEIRQMKGLPTTDTCTHTFTEYEICSICGEKHKKENHYGTNMQ